MRKFSSYGPLDRDLHYYAPRTALIDAALRQLVGEDPQKGGHYITVWAPRQTGKTWVMQQVLTRLRADERFDVVKLNLQHLKKQTDALMVVQTIANDLLKNLGKDSVQLNKLEEFASVFASEVLAKPLILILDEFDALNEETISDLAGILRNIYINRRDQTDIPAQHKDYLLHGVALIGVRSVLGIENVTGSPFNVQRSLHIPNLTYKEVDEMFAWHERESGQKVESDVIKRLYDETLGHPGLTCWFGELLTEGFEGYRPPQNAPITSEVFREVYAAATHILPNNTILNILSKAKQPPYKELVFKVFQTDEPLEFTYHNSHVNFLYLNGIITQEKIAQRYVIKFSCPFVQKSLFQYFARELFQEVGKLYEVFENLEDVITDEALNIRNLMRRYEGYLRQNRDWLLQDAPRRVDLRIYEAVYHFNLYMYLHQFLQRFGGRVYPEFPTGNGKIDLIIDYAGQRYGLEIKSFSTHKEYQKALTQAALYGSQLGLTEIALVVFVERIDEANRRKYEAAYTDNETGIRVTPVFVETGE